MANHVTLRKFTESELIFNNEETKLILKFIFRSQSSAIDKLTINNKLREFAQGLLLEAIDASYAMGFVEAIFRASANPTVGAKKVIAKFTKKAAKHWFKHATANNLLNVEIYEIVRRTLEFNFARYLQLILNGLAKKETEFSAVLSYA